MSAYSLTKEQKAIIQHPHGHHAKILAVAGSGKTTTLVHRIKFLVMDKQVYPSSIRVLMFNRLARQQFSDKLREEGIPLELHPKVDTFHSFAYGFIQDLITKGLLPGNWDYWIDDQEEQVRITLHQVINTLERSKLCPPDSMDIEEAQTAIQLWKSSLIPPNRAGYDGNPNMPKVYFAFEEERVQRHALTYDDFVPLVVAHLNNNQELLDQFGGTLEHLIVDEYQDVNYGQQCLIELLAGTKADVMVVGDDDQTIYEWRGARPSYIIREFQTIFNDKPYIQYTLSNSFRFGPVIAQCAYNTIRFNTNRVHKALVAYEIKKPANIFLYEYSADERRSSNKQLCDQMITLVKNNSIPPSKIIILCRMFAQLSSIQAEFMSRKIPFRVVGQKPFFKRREIQVLVDYIKLSAAYSHPINELIQKSFINISNTPNRMIARKDFQQLIENAVLKSLTLKQALVSFVAGPFSPLNGQQKERVFELMSCLEQTHKKLADDPVPLAQTILADLISSLDYLAHYDNYYGKGESSYERKQSILNFIAYAEETKLPPLEFVEHLALLDTTRGAPEEQQIVMTTIFRTKGLEYDYVVIPDCEEGYMPCLFESGQRVFDTHGQVREPEPSEAIENERRLFYVAVTRAKEAVYIGASLSKTNIKDKKSGSPQPSRFIDEIQWEPTTNLMTSLQHVAVGEPESQSSLISNVYKYGGIKTLSDILLSKYLVALGDSALMAKIAQIIATRPEHPFGYRFPNPRAKIAGMEQGQDNPRLHSAWDDID